MRIINDIKLDFKDVLILPKRSTLSSRSEVDLCRTFRFLHSGNDWTGVPIMVSNMDTTGTFAVAEALSSMGVITCIHKHCSVSEWKEFAASNAGKLENVSVSIGNSEGDLKKLEQILEVAPVPFVTIDVANGYTEKFVAFVKKVRAKYPKKNIIAGNVVTGEMVEELLLSGADVVKIGIGSGSVCTTRIKTGVGYPQLSAVIECADAAHGLKGMIVSDGGCACSGDISKAFGAGADFAMIGGMLAGHDECGGDVFQRGNEKVKTFYGMSSSKAMKKHYGGVNSYRAAEGKSVVVPVRGPVSETVKDILGGIRSTCTYVGARRLRELSRRTTFVRVSMQANQVFNDKTFKN